MYKMVIFLIPLPVNKKRYNTPSSNVKELAYDSVERRMAQLWQGTSNDETRRTDHNPAAVQLVIFRPSRTVAAPGFTDWGQVLLAFIIPYCNKKHYMGAGCGSTFIHGGHGPQLVP